MKSAANDRQRLRLLCPLLLSFWSGVSVAQEVSTQPVEDDSARALRQEANQRQRHTESRAVQSRERKAEQAATIERSLRTKAAAEQEESRFRSAEKQRQLEDSQLIKETRESAQSRIPAEQEKERQADRTPSGGAEANEIDQRETKPPTEAKEAAEKIDEPRPERDSRREPKPQPESESEPEPETQPEREATAEDKADETRHDTVKPARIRQPIRPGGSLLSHSAPPPVPVPPARQMAPTNPNSEPTVNPDTQPYEPGELLLISANMTDAQTAARQLQAYQLRIKSRERLDNLGLVISVFRLPPDANLPSLTARLRTELPDLNLDANQRYQLLNGRREYAQRLIGWPESSGTCIGNFRIGMLDTAVADQHPALVNTALVRRNFVRGTAASSIHGTAVASLLVGEPGSLVTGILPGSQLFAAEVFRQRDTSADTVTDTTTETLLGALDWLVSQKVQAINLSLGGERNRVFELALTQLLKRKIHLVAAAGNQGPDAPPVFPAAQLGVIAVTAVDAAEQLYPMANQGNYIDVAAPGVDIWAADGESHGRYHSGTSFAAPFVTAALLIADDQGIDLLENAKDLGPEGRDDRFGRGLVQVTGCR